MRIERLIERYRGRGSLINIVLDGWGKGDRGEGDAVFQARTPNLDQLFTKYPNSQILTHGGYVGLPSPQDIGGSEVGHITMGAGKIIPQGPTRIKNLMESGEFFKNEVLNKLLDNCTGGSNALHLIGLLSDGNVHSHISHFEQIIRFAGKKGVGRLYVHPLLDGRDVPYQSALDYVESLEELLVQTEAARPGWEYAIASGGGREVITMDRDNNWEKVRMGWEAHVLGESGLYVNSVTEHIRECREKSPGLVDQDIPPFVVKKDGAPVATINDGDSVIFMNFRGDRAREFTRAMVEEDFNEFERGRVPKVLFAGMALYDEDTNLPPERLIDTAKVKNPFGRRILELGMNQFRLAETQKYAHVTFFYNGGYGKPLDPEKENYCLIPSDKVKSFADYPEMKAAEIGMQAVDLIKSGTYHYGLINFANTDMVGHTGDLKAAIIAAEAVDRALGDITKALSEEGGVALITADHGNAEEMISPNPKTGIREPNTRHSINPVPVVIFDPLADQGETPRLIFDDSKPNTLSNIMATNYILMGKKPPDDIEPPLFELD